MNSVDEPSQKYIYDQLETHACTPGALEHLHRVFIISTTMEVDRRIARTKPAQEGH